MGKTSLYLSRFAQTAYVCWKVVVNILRMPLYALLHREYFRAWRKALVANVINMEKDCQSAIPMLDCVALQEMLGGQDPAIAFKFGSKYGNINFVESIVVAYIVKSLKPRMVFEIGTFDGFSAYHLAMNSPDDAEIYTLNLPINDNGDSSFRRTSLTEFHGDATTHDELLDRGVGTIYKHSPQGHKVKQLFGDSLTYDFSPFKGKMDLVFIDGGHSLTCITKDTSSATEMLSSRGVILWHDFNIQHRDIYRFLSQFSGSHRIYWIKDTRLALYRRGDGKTTE